MSKYQIMRWDVILGTNGLNKVPIIYILPDLKFLEFIKNNDCKVMVEISGTNTMYDRVQIPAKVNKSSFMPNYFEQTNLFVIILECEWLGYPETNAQGFATFYGLRS
jgi:hypothetical protein